MFDELRLPEELAACEARLASQPLATSGIDRDQLMYRAGWAACEASRAASRALVDRGLATVAGWSLTSAAVAASLAVIVTLQWRPVIRQEVAAISTGSDSPRPSIPAEQRRAVASPSHLTTSLPGPSRTMELDMGLFRLRRQALGGDWSEPGGIASLTAESAPPAPQTAFELRQELLPSEAAVPATIWPWGI